MGRKKVINEHEIYVMRVDLKLMTVFSFQSLQHKTASFTEDEIKGEHDFEIILQ